MFKIPPINGIPYDFNGCLSLENRYIILAEYVRRLYNDVDNNFNEYLTNWANENLSNILGDIMYTEETENLKFKI